MTRHHHYPDNTDPLTMIDTSCGDLAPAASALTVVGRVSGNQYCLLETAGLTYTYTPREGRQTAQRQFIVPWDQIDAFMIDFGGSYQWGTIPSGTGSNIFQTWLPATFPGKPWLAVDHIHVVPMGAIDDICWTDSSVGPDGNQLNLPKPTNGYKATVSYVTKRYYTNDDDPQIPVGVALEFKTDFGANAILLPTPGLSWQINGVYDPVEQNVNVTKFEPTQTVDIAWKFVPLPPWSRIEQSVGALNSKPFFGLPERTVMFVGCGADATMQVGNPSDSNPFNTGVNPNNDALGVTMWSLHFKFQIRQILIEASDFAGWDYFFRTHPKGTDPNYQRVVSTQTKDDIFPEVDFYKLFTVGNLYTDPTGGNPSSSFDFGLSINAPPGATLQIGLPYVQ
jgi:hypothetical protein